MNGNDQSPALTAELFSRDVRTPRLDAIRLGALARVADTTLKSQPESGHASI